MSKGKSKIDEPDQVEIGDESGDCCGICLSEGGNGGVSRGFINSCSHYFCFVCIMEWAKVESKCPFCKRRFSSIRRPPKPPVFSSERVVHVPVRDQVYHYFGNATTGPPDPYSESKCTVCHGVADESLLLLCDLCDSAAHTYCVGLGATVPEGDWFCQDCTLLKDEQSRLEMSTESGVQNSFDPIHKTTSTDEPVSVYDIVQEPYGQRYRSTFLDSGPSDEVIRETNNLDRTHPRSQRIVSEYPMKPNARTLRHCRGLHDRIRVMRENWNGFRSGIVQFSSSPDVGNISTKKSVTCNIAHQSSFDQQPKAQCSSSHATDDIGAQDMEKAWKMMEKAKSIKQRLERSRKYTTRKLNAVKKSDYMPCTPLSLDSHQNIAKNIASIRPRQQYQSLGKEEWGRHVTKDVNICEGSISGRSSKRQELESYNVRKGENSCERSTCLSSSVMSDPVILKTDVNGVNCPSSSSSKLKQPMEKRELKKINVDPRKFYNVKTEIQSLVKLNLKLQTKKEKLEVNTFKEVARHATHSILAACDLELPRPGSCSIPGFSCSHPNEARLQKASLMANCCRECFYIFVKEMVNTVILQKKTCR